MKRILLLFVAICYSVFAFSQNEIKITEEPVKIYTLEEVELVSDKSEIICKKPICRKAHKTNHYFCCKVSGVLIDELSRENQFKSIKLFPNPSVNGIFHINFQEKYNTVKVLVSGISAQTILSQSYQNVTNKVSINLSQFPAGIYLIKIIADDKPLPTKKAIRG